MGLACRPPSEAGNAITHWSAAELRDAFAASADGADIGTRTVARVLDEAGIQPHRIRYFLTSRDPEFVPSDSSSSWQLSAVVGSLG